MYDKKNIEISSFAIHIFSLFGPYEQIIPKFLGFWVFSLNLLHVTWILALHLNQDILERNITQELFTYSKAYDFYFIFGENFENHSIVSQF